MGTTLSAEAEKTIIQCALRFDGYGYARSQATVDRDEHACLAELVNTATSTEKYAVNPVENFAAYFAVLRSYYPNGLPTILTPQWYAIVFYYLHLYRLPTPAAHRHDLDKEWRHRPKGAAERAAAEIRQLLRQCR